MGEKIQQVTDVSIEERRVSKGLLLLMYKPVIVFTYIMSLPHMHCSGTVLYVCTGVERIE